MEAVEGPLKGVRILELSNALAGPLAVGILADQGADVIKVEPPGIGDILRFVGSRRNGVSSIFEMANRGKRSISLNLKTPKGLEVVRRLIRDADVVLHNFRPGVAERLGVGYEEARKIRDDIIYVSITGFGSKGPQSGKRAYDNIIQAFSGVTQVQGNVETGEPMFVYQVFVDKLTALTASQAICAALFARAQGRGGQQIEVSLLDSTLAFLWVDGAGVNAFIGEGAEAGAPLARGVRLIAFKNGWGTASPLSDSEFFGFCETFGFDVREDPIFADVMARVSHPKEVIELMDRVWEAAASWDVDEAIGQLEERDVPCAKVKDLADLPDDLQVRANGLFVETEHPIAGKMRETRSAAVFSATPAGVGAPSPSLGQHTDEILHEIGFADRSTGE